MNLLISISNEDYETIKETSKHCSINRVEQAVVNGTVLLETLEQEPILDKIRAEIEQRPYGVANDSVIQGMKYERIAILEILDKYKAESEDKE